MLFFTLMLQMIQAKSIQIDLAIPVRRHDNARQPYQQAIHCIDLCRIHSCDIWILDKLAMECYVLEELSQFKTFKHVLHSRKIPSSLNAIRQKVALNRWMVGSYQRQNSPLENIHYFDNAESYSSLIRDLSAEARKLKPSQLRSAVDKKQAMSVQVESESNCQKHCQRTHECNWYRYCPHTGTCSMFDSEWNHYDTHHRHAQSRSKICRVNSVHQW